MRRRVLPVAALLALVSCRVNADGTFGSADIVLRTDRRPVLRPVEPEPPPPPPKPVPPPEPVAAPPLIPATPAAPFDDRLPPPAQPTEHAPAPWPFDVQHYDIEVNIDPRQHSIEGSVTIDLADAADGLKELQLDAADLTITSVASMDSEPGTVTTSYDGKRLRIPLAEPRTIGTKRRFRIEYSGHPTRGLFFNDGDPPQVYTQGEMEDSRYWFPCHDAPDDRATHSIWVNVQDPFATVTAGGVFPRREGFWFSTQRYFPHPATKLDVPHVAYLVNFVLGDYDVVEQRGVVPLQFVVEKRDAPYAAACFRKTNEVLTFFGDYTGLPYPYPKYSQTCVRNFMYGGMENIGATTLTDHAIHPPEWEPAHDSTSLVAHEAAHQWFGDWITCSDWSHTWLNEGFATYFDLLFTEKDEGRDAFLWRLRGERLSALGAMDGERRAVVSNRWADPFDMFDGHAYAGGAVRLHMLRDLLGDKEFQGAIRHYVKTCGLKCITTDDFQKAVEEFTGQDLGWWFDQWFRKPGYPVLKVRWKWDEAKKAAVVTVEQTQKAEGGVPEVYRMPLTLVLECQRFLPDGVPTTERVELTQRVQTFEVPLKWGLSDVVVDPQSALLARIDVERTVERLRLIALSESNPSTRIDAVDALGAIVRDEKRAAADRDAAHSALIDVLKNEKFAPLRAPITGLVALRKDDDTAELLVEAMNSDPDLRVRLAAADVLSGFDGNLKARDALTLLLNHPNDLLRAAAVTGIARLKHPLAFESLTAQVDRPGWHSVVRNAALRGFGDLGNERAFPTLVRFAAPGDNWSRGVAIEQLGRMGRKRPEYRDAVLPYLDDPERTIRQSAAQALGAMGDPDTIGTLVEHFAKETWPATKDALRNAVRACRGAAVEEGRLVSVEAIRAAPIRERHAALRDEADALEPTIAGLAGDAKTAAAAKLKSLRDEAWKLQCELDALGVPHKPKPKTKP